MDELSALIARSHIVSANTLVVCEPRLGWLIRGNPDIPPDTPEVAVMLRDTGTDIELTVPLSSILNPADHYARWWSSGIMRIGDSDDYTERDIKPPRVLLFCDKDGFVVLVGCRAGRGRLVMGGPNRGSGIIVANYAVLGGRSLRYEAINGMRTEIPALMAWTRFSSMKVDRHHDEHNRLQSVQMKLSSIDSVKLAQTLDLTMHSTWIGTEKLGYFSAREHIVLETNVRDASSWDEHFLVHGAVLDLVSLSAWRPFGFAKVEVCRHDDPKLGPGKKRYDRWSQVVTYRLPKQEEQFDKQHFLFLYEELGPSGVEQWLDLREKYSQGLDPVFGILRSDSPWSESSTVQSGIALETLGYLIDTHKHNGVKQCESKRRQISFGDALKLIVDDMEVMPFDDVDAWLRRAREVYMGLKHYDCSTPDSLILLNTLRDNLLVIRFWVGLQLGVCPETLKDSLRNDPLSKKFIGID